MHLNREVSDTVDLNWEDIGFGLVPTDYMYITKSSPNGTFAKGELQRFGPIDLNPASGVLNYGQVSVAEVLVVFLYLSCITIVALCGIMMACLSMSGFVHRNCHYISFPYNWNGFYGVWDCKKYLEETSCVPFARALIKCDW